MASLPFLYSVLLQDHPTSCRAPCGIDTICPWREQAGASAECCTSASIELDVYACVSAYTARLAARDESSSADGIAYDAAIGTACLHDLEALRRAW